MRLCLTAALLAASLGFASITQAEPLADRWNLADLYPSLAAWEADEPEMEYQIANALLERGHEVRLLGVRDDLEELIRQLGDWDPELVFNGAEAFRGEESLEYLLPGLLEAEGYDEMAYARIAARHHDR